jgi:hypothetical protein
MITEERIYRSLARRKDDVFVRNELAALGSEAQVNRALRNLLSRGVIVKLGVGVYAKAKKSVLTGAPIPVKPLSVLAPIALQKLGVKTFPSQLTQAYNNGRSTQLPIGNVVNIGKSRVSRKLGFGQQTIAYETNQRLPI